MQVVERYPPRYEVSLFDAKLFLSSFRHDEAIDFFVVYVGLRDVRGNVRRYDARVVYKDVSLVWRAASHVSFQDGEAWIGKGDVKWERRADGEYEVSAEETTNLPYELQGALDELTRRGRKQADGAAVPLILREGPPNRVRAYADFTAPRERARASFRIHAGRPVARFTRRNDPWLPALRQRLRARFSARSARSQRLRQPRLRRRSAQVPHRFEQREDPIPVRRHTDPRVDQPPADAHDRADDVLHTPPRCRRRR